MTDPLDEAITKRLNAHSRTHMPNESCGCPDLVLLRAAQTQLRRQREALRMTRAYNEHHWNCHTEDCRECADLKSRMVALRIEALGDTKNPPEWSAALSTPSADPVSGQKD